MRKRVLATCAAALLIGAGGVAAGNNSAPVVRVEQGRLSGTEAEAIAAFKGIPFAAPPVGELRWRAPQPAAPWQGVRAADHYGADCMQKPFPGDAAPLGRALSEDCLYLNVWAPAAAVAKPSARRPVMVWIYGGGFVNGGTSSAIYDGSAFARDGVVLVSFNYRLGRFGFFAHPALSAAAGAEPVGNYGYMDQLAALAWVKRNVAAFGGDPGNVTVFGESAGGMSVHMLLNSPLAKGLFDKAIIESGGGRANLLPSLPLGDAEKSGLAFAASQGIADSGPAGLAALRGLPDQAVMDGLSVMNLIGPTYSGPMVDGKVVPVDPPAVYDAEGKDGVSTADAPVIVGANSADGIFLGGTLESLWAPFGAGQDLARRLYDPQGTGIVQEIGRRMAGDSQFIEPSRHVARRLSALGRTVYFYRYSYVPESMRAEWKEGVPHAAEIPFVFDSAAARYGERLTRADEAAAKTIHAYWVAFAKTGRPDPAGLPAWPALRPADRDRLMDFGIAGPRLIEDPLKDRLDLAEKVPGRDFLSPPQNR